MIISGIHVPYKKLFFLSIWQRQIESGIIAHRSPFQRSLLHYSAKNAVSISAQSAW